MSRTPSRRVLWTMVVTVAVVGGTIATSAVLEAREARAGETGSYPSLPVAIGRDSELAVGADEDGDALLDWEEALRGTDPKNGDTDGDGTPDGEEVATGRDPRVPGPNDSRSEVASSTDARLDAAYQAMRRPGTETDRFAQEFASAYFQLKADGGFTDADRATLMSSVVGALDVSTGVSASYSANLLPKLPSTDPASLRVYGDTFASTHEEVFKSLAALSASGNAKDYGEGFRELGRRLAGIQTPAEIADAHVRVANAYETMGQVVNLLARGDDPLASLAAVPSLQKAESARAEASAEIARYLAAQGVALQSGSYAAFWTTIGQQQ